MSRLKSKVLSIISSTTNIEKAKANGLCIGTNVFVGSGTFIDPSHCFLITIGNNVTLSSKVHILAHDASTKVHLGYTKVGRVKIGNNVFVGACSIILPGISIGDNSIIGGGSVVTKNIPSNEVWAGNPAKFICSKDEYLKKYKDLQRFDKSYRINVADEKKKEELKRATERGICFLE